MKSVSFDINCNTNIKGEIKKPIKRNTHILMNQYTRLKINNTCIMKMQDCHTGKYKAIKNYYTKLWKTTLSNFDISYVAELLCMEEELFRQYLKVYKNIHPRTNEEKLIQKLFTKLAKNLRYFTYTTLEYNGMYDKKKNKMHIFVKFVKKDNRFIQVTMQPEEYTIKNISSYYICIDDFELPYKNELMNSKNVILLSDIIREQKILEETLSSDDIKILQEIYDGSKDNYNELEENLDKLSDILKLPAFLYNIEIEDEECCDLIHVMYYLENGSLSRRTYTIEIHRVSKPDERYNLGKYSFYKYDYPMTKLKCATFKRESKFTRALNQVLDEIR